MKMLKVSVILFASLLILGSVSATTITQGYNAEREAQYTPPNALQKLLNFISNLFGNEIFSIAGERWQCDALPHRGGIFTSGALDESYFAMTPNSLVKTSSPEFCGGSGLFDTFINWGAGPLEDPQTEYKNSVDFYCPSTATGCQLQLYCCDHFDCTSNSDCTSWFGSGYTCEPTDDTDPKIDFDWSSWKYCKLIGTDPDHRCWRNVLGYCEEKQPPYKQSWIDANGGKCPISWPYESLSTCQADIPHSCSDLAISLGACTTLSEKKCGTAVDVPAVFECRTYYDTKCWQVKEDCPYSCSNEACTGGDGGETCTSQGGTKELWPCNFITEQELDASDVSFPYTCCKLKTTGVYNPVDPLTRTQLYSADYSGVANAGCIPGIRMCNSKEGYAVSCIDASDKIIEKRIKEELTADCENFIKDITLNIPIISGGFANLVCQEADKFSILQTALPGYGICIAKSSGLGGIWDNYLDIVYGFGLPAKWVVPVAIGLIIILIILLVPMLRK